LGTDDWGLVTCKVHSSHALIKSPRRPACPPRPVLRRRVRSRL
jgi:hypothetical protein